MKKVTEVLQKLKKVGFFVELKFNPTLSTDGAGFNIDAQASYGQVALENYVTYSLTGRGYAPHEQLEALKQKAKNLQKVPFHHLNELGILDLSQRFNSELKAWNVELSIKELTYKLEGGKLITKGEITFSSSSADLTCEGEFKWDAKMTLDGFGQFIASLYSVFSSIE